MTWPLFVHVHVLKVECRQQAVWVALAGVKWSSMMRDSVKMQVVFRTGSTSISGMAF